MKNNFHSVLYQRIEASALAQNSANPRNLESFFFRIDPDILYFDLTLFRSAPTSVT
jgi:hypothetical protein